MFGTKKNPQQDDGTARKDMRNSHNLVGQGTRIEGEIVCEGDIRIDGSLHGQLHSKAKVVVGPTGKLDGEIVCANADISGEVEGTIRVAEVLHLKSTAKFTGNVVTAKLVIDAGAMFNGNCSMPSDGKVNLDAPLKKANTDKQHDKSEQAKQSPAGKAAG